MSRQGVLSLCLALAANCLGAVTPTSAPAGVVVEKVVPGFEAAKSGIQPGDILLAWVRPANPPANPAAVSGAFRSPFDVLEVYIDQAPRAKTLALGLSRDGKTTSTSILQYPWGLETRPRFSEKWLARYELGKQRIDQGERDDGLAIWRALAAELSGAQQHVNAAWLWLRIGKAQSEAKEVDRAIASIDQALAATRPTGRREIDAQLWGAKVEVFRGANRRDEAQTAARQALAIREQMSPNSLAVAYAIHELSSVMAREKPEYETINRRALRIREKLAPGSRAEAGTVLNLAFVADGHGDSRTTVELSERVLRIHQSLNPGSRDVARALSNLCADQMNRGELASAEDYCERSLEVWRSLGPGDLGGVANVLHNMGVLARLQGDLDRAVMLFFQSIEVSGRIPPDAPGYPAGYNYYDLAVTELERDIDKAEEYLDLSEQLMGKMEAGDSSSGSLRALTRANIAYQRNDLVGAEKLLRQAVAYFDATAPNHPIAGYIRDDLGRVLTERGLSSEAEEHIRRALAQRQVYGPGSQESAQSYYNLGMLLWKTGRLVEAEAALRQAIEEYEAQKGKLGGSDDSLSKIAGRFADFYKDYLRLLVELGREQDAFLILERYRAGSFLRTLAQRDLALPDDVPAELDLERRLTNSEYDRTQAHIRGLDPASQATELATALTRLGELRRKQEDIAARITSASPRYGALRYPRPLDLAGAKAALAPGTLLLSYAVGREKIYLFVLPGGPGGSLDVHVLPLGEKELRASVDAFRRLIQWSRPGPELGARRRTLYEQLLEPAQKRIAAADRLLIVADGPLHKLPWAALALDAAGGRARFLGEWKPMHSATSVTVYAELRKSRPEIARNPSVAVAAFGDPKYPATTRGRRTAAKRGDGSSVEIDAEKPSPEIGDAGDPQLSSVLRGGFDLTPLPESRAEVAAIAALYSPRAAAYLGADATEERAASVGRNVPLIHYACHAVVNERFPLDSALVFTIPEKPGKGQDNGLLQAWEIFERMRLDADLVTLSACESGLGKEMAGEGLVGLTRAFQYAGARSVLSSLWKVDDKATAELMKRFYGYLKAGKTKDEALRLAQIDLIRSSDFSQPRDWAAFQLNGDWK